MIEALLGFAAVFVLALLRVPLAFAMGFVGYIGLGLMRGWGPTAASAVQVVYDPAKVSLETLLAAFWENHDPTTGMRQGNDIGSTYRSGIYTYDDAQAQAAQASKARYGAILSKAGFGAVTTEVIPAPVFYFAEDYHQQYLAKNPDGYCGVRGTGVSCPVGLAVAG